MKTLQELRTGKKLFIEVVIFAETNTFFQSTLACTADSPATDLGGAQRVLSNKTFFVQFLLITR